MNTTTPRTLNNTAAPTGYLVLLGRTWQNGHIYLTRSGGSSRVIGDARVYATADGARRSYPDLEIVPVWADPRRAGRDALLPVERDW